MASLVTFKKLEILILRDATFSSMRLSVEKDLVATQAQQVWVGPRFRISNKFLKNAAAPPAALSVRGLTSSFPVIPRNSPRGCVSVMPPGLFADLQGLDTHYLQNAAVTANFVQGGSGRGQ